MSLQSREEHLAWAKRRALAYVDHGDIAQAVTSMLSDLSKHPELKVHPAVAYQGIMFTHTPDDARRWIDGFN